MLKKIRIVLEESEVKKLKEVTRKGKNNARTITRARILLMANENGESKSSREIEDILKVGHATVTRIKQKYRAGGIEEALYDAKRPGQPERLTSKEKAEIIAIACSDAPKGYERWTIELLTEKANKEFKKSISRSTINRVLLKNDTKPWLKKNVVC